MAASDVIAAAIAALLVSPPPMHPAAGDPGDVRCVPALVRSASDARPWTRPRPGDVRAPIARALGCAEPISGVMVTLNWVRGWFGGTTADIAAQPRAAVSVAALPDPADADPIQRLARLVIDEWRERDPNAKLDRKQLVCLQRALYFEARGEGALGQAAVAHVALNRVGTRPGRASVCDVVREPGQFAPFLTGEPDETDLVQTDDDATRVALETAAQVMAGEIPDPSRGGQYFYAPRLLKIPPAWAKGMKETARIGGHRFFVARD